MKFEQVCQSMNTFFKQNPIIRILIPISIPIMLICVAFQVMGYFIALGSVMQTVSYLGFFFMVLLVLSECRFKMAFIGLGIYALMHVYPTLLSLLKFHAMNWGGIINLLFFGYLAYQCYRKSLQINQ